MSRLIVAVVVGYLVLSAVVMGAFSAAYLAMGTERAFEPGSYAPSGLWLVVSFVIGLAAALLAGFVSVRIARSAKAAKWLAALVVVLGVLFAVPTLRAPDTADTVRTGDVPNFEAMTKAKQPKWVALVNPLVGAAGVLLGGRRKGAR